MIYEYNPFLAGFNPEELSCLSNIFGFVIIFFCVNTITSIFFLVIKSLGISN